LWRTEGGRGFTVSKESRPNDAKEAAAVEDYLHRTRWQHILLSKWLKALASETWKTYWEAYQRQRERGDLGVLDDGDMGCFSGRALLIQAVVNPHKDDTDVRGGLVLTFPTGLYGGGEVTIFEYGLRFAQEAGDILIAPMQVLTHMLDPIYGYRHGNVYTVKEEVLNPPKRPFICDICSLDYKAKSSLNQHKNETRGGKDLGGLHMAARARKDFDAYKKFGRNPAVKLDEFMESWDDPAEFRYPCDYPGCNATSTTTRGVKTHKVNIHGEKRGEQGDEDDACGCGCSC